MPHQASGNTTAEEPTGLVAAVSYLLDVPAEIAPIKGPLAKVTVSMGMIITNPNDKFQNVKPVVSIEMPCSPDKVDAAFELSYGWVDDKLSEINQAVLAGWAG